MAGLGCWETLNHLPAESVSKDHLELQVTCAPSAPTLYCVTWTDPAPTTRELHQNISLLLLSVSARPFSGSWRDIYGRLVNTVSSRSVTGAALGRWTKATTGGRGGRSEAREANLPACPAAANWSRERQVTPKCHMGSDPWADWNNVSVTNPDTTPWTSHFYLLSLNFLIRSVHGAINIPGNSPWHCHLHLLQIIIKISSSSKNLHYIKVALNYA